MFSNKLITLVIFNALLRASLGVYLNCTYQEVFYFPKEKIFLTCVLKNVKYDTGLVSFSYQPKNITFHELVKRVKFVSSSLNTIPNAIFQKFLNLEILEVFSCGLRDMNGLSLNNAENLKILMAYDNKLITLQDYSLIHVKKLENLDLSRNKIESIRYHAFSGLEKLQELSLSQNRISAIDNNIFLPLTSLKWIWLGRNKLTLASVHLFSKANINLEGVYLNNNNISAISPYLFDNLDALKFLFLAGNHCINMDFVNLNIANNVNMKKNLNNCYKEYRNLVPDEEQKHNIKQLLNDVELDNTKCEEDKAFLLESLDNINLKIKSAQTTN
ncbi:unnamed protein product [Diamesa serratosioi]